MRILLIAYFYPPLGGPGVQRPVKFVKYLTKLGVSVDVLTVKDIQFHSYDYELLNEDKSRKTYRTISFDPMSIMKKIPLKKADSQKVYFNTNEKLKKRVRGIFPIDDKIGWFFPAYKKGLTLCQNYSYDYIISTIGPFTSALIAYYLSKKTNIPFILDYRDLWTLEPYSRYQSLFQLKLAECYEKKILKNAFLVTTVGQVMANQLTENFGQYLKDKIHVMYNGFDEDDFSKKNKPSINHTDKLVYRYIGNFYGHQNVKYFIQALLELDQLGAIPDKAVFEFYGNYYIETLQEFQKVKNKNLLLIKSQTEHLEAIELMKSSDFLLLFVSSVNSQGVITGKLFEYLRSEKPIIAMVPQNGEAEELLKHNGHDLITTMENVEGIKKLLIKSFQEKISIEKCSYDQYSREYQTEQFYRKLYKPVQSKKLFHLQLLPLLTGVQNVMIKILEPLSSEYSIEIGSKPQGDLVKAVKDKGWKHIPIPSLRREISIMDIKAFFDLYFIFKKNQFDIVHTHSSKTGFLGRIAARMAGIRHIVHTVHGLPFNDSQPLYVQIIYEWLEKIASNHCDKVVFINKAEYTTALKKKIVRPDQAELIYNGVKIPKSYINKPKKEKITIGFSGRFTFQKNIIMTIKTAIQACKKHSNLQFFFVGDGPDFPLCSKMIRNAGLQEQILLPGWKTNMEDYLKCFDVFILFSLYEGLPLSILEAMAHSLPVICSDITGNNELVDDSTGYLVQPGNMNHLLKTFDHIATHPEELPLKGEKAYQKCKTYFNLDSFQYKYALLYKEMLKND